MASAAYPSKTSHPILSARTVRDDLRRRSLELVKKISENDKFAILLNPVPADQVPGCTDGIAWTCAPSIATSSSASTPTPTTCALTSKSSGPIASSSTPSRPPLQGSRRTPRTARRVLRGILLYFWQRRLTVRPAQGQPRERTRINPPQIWQTNSLECPTSAHSSHFVHFHIAYRTSNRHASRYRRNLPSDSTARCTRPSLPPHARHHRRHPAHRQA